jgi:hypothetical protein
VERGICSGNFRVSDVHASLQADHVLGTLSMFHCLFHSNLLFIAECNFEQEQKTLVVSTAVESGIQHALEIQYFLRGAGDSILTLEKAASEIQYGVVSGSALESLLRMMNKVYLPTFMSNASWPESTFFFLKCFSVI